MTLNQLPSTIDYAMTTPTPVIIVLASAIAAIIFIGLLFMAMDRDLQPWITVTFALGAIVSLITIAFGMNAAEGDLARFRGEAVSQHLEQTYGMDVGFTEDGVQPDDLDGRTVHDGGSVYRIAVATDGSILLVDEGGKEVPRVTR